MQHNKITISNMFSKNKKVVKMIKKKKIVAIYVYSKKSCVNQKKLNNSTKY